MKPHQQIPRKRSPVNSSRTSLERGFVPLTEETSRSPVESSPIEDEEQQKRYAITISNSKSKYYK
eukprot:UN09291